MILCKRKKEAGPQWEQKAFPHRHSRAFCSRELWDYRAVVFDMDGTLYDQPKLRALMVAALLKYYVLHPTRGKELLILYRYRKAREQWNEMPKAVADQPSGERSKAAAGKRPGEKPETAAQEDKSLEEAQYAFVGERMRVPADRVRRLVRHWMQEYPLHLLPRCKDRRLASLIKELRKREIPVVVYSDYPAEEKLAALQIPADYVFCSGDPDINCMKPDPKGLQVILRRLNLSPKEVLFIGDRYEKDGLCARNADVDFIILSRTAIGRHRPLRPVSPL